MDTKDLKARIEALSIERETLREEVLKRIEQVKERNKKFKVENNVYDAIKASEIICEDWGIDEFTDFLPCDKELSEMSAVLWDDMEDDRDLWDTDSYPIDVMQCVDFTLEYQVMIDELEEAMFNEQSKQLSKRRRKTDSESNEKVDIDYNTMFYSLMNKIMTEANTILCQELKRE